MRKILIGSLVAFVTGALLTLSAPVRTFAQNVACYFDQGGAGFHAGSGCTISIESGGTLAVKTPLYLGGTGSAGGAAVDGMLTKSVTGIADNTATTVLTVTIPNAAHAATIPVVITASLGAGGAVGAFEETLTAYGQIVVTRTPGAAAVAVATTLSNTGKASVSGGDSTGTLAYAVSAVSGGASATDTFNVTITVAHGAGSSTNHSAIIQADVINANASGITVS